MTRVISVGVMVALVGCAISTRAPKLTAENAVRIADRKTHSFGAHLAQYTRSSAQYEASDHGWWVHYSPKSRGETLNNGFSVLVRDDSREASIVMP